MFAQDPPDGFEHGLYDYYAERLGRARADLYDPITDRRYLSLLQRVGKLAPGRRLLDVGCGEGHLLDAATRAGWQPLGLDLSEHAIAICQAFGLPARQVDFFSPELDGVRFDVITMFELIEHVSRPSAFLARAEALLVPGGVLHLTTPNFDSFDRRVLGAQWPPIHPEHIGYFTPVTLQRTLERETSLKVHSLEVRNLSVGVLAHLAWAPVRALRSRLPAASPLTAAKEAPAPPPADLRHDLRLRRMLELGPLRQAKRLANWGLDRTGLGAAMEATCVKPA